ncbi:MAG: DNA gyrase subunit A [Gammaproteobacteria bacterium]|nr:MAG: DNA gyrase subunit A [Gammaproteobacteria bacterium]
MAEIAREVLLVSLEGEMRQSYLDYAMSVIVGRALPDVRDGLKPVHRRVLHAMRELGNDWNKAYKKSARVVGDVIGKYHPHGESAVYDTIVRMAQPFSLRYLLVDGQGNFGSVDGDPPAAMRYTEVRMSRIAHELLADIAKETVEFTPNYDETELEPSVLPTRIPNLLVNGQTGIAVGMATNIPPHNLTETVDACLALLEDPSLPLASLMQHMPGPDFPTGGIINGAQEIATAYRTGRGRLSVRARVSIEDIGRGDRQAIVVTELPYQVNKARLIERIAELVREKQIDGIAGDGLRDESDKDGMRIVIELRRGEVTEIVLNNLYAQTPLETVFGINMVALQDGQPKLMSLKEMLEAFIRHRREVVTRRTIFDLAKARERAHILEGLAVALANIDAVIALIKAAASPAEARAGLLARSWPPGIVSELLERAGAISTRPRELPAEAGLAGGAYRLSDGQAQAILDMRLHRLTGLEQDKIVAEYRELLAQLQDLSDILARPERLTQVVREELLEIRTNYGDARRTEINRDHLDLTTEDLIEPQDVVVTLSHAGYAKSQPLTEYQTQRRGGRGQSAKPMVNLLPLEEGEKINALLPIKQYDEQHFVFMATRAGTVKKTPLSAFSRPRSTGIIAVDLHDNDQLVGVALTDGEREIILVSSGGKAIRFHESEVRDMGREAAGVRGIRLGSGQQLISLIVVGEGHVLTGSAAGYGKRSPLAEFPVHGRGGQGVIALQTSDRNGDTVAALQVMPGQEIMLISSTGALVRTAVDEISVQGRNTQGVRLIRLGEGERLAGIGRVESLDTGEEEAAAERELQAGAGEPAADT